MVNRVNTLSIYIPKAKQSQRPMQRLLKLSETKDRSVNYLVMEAILQYLDREEQRG
jgi:predicted transcriptional regulator